jgi:hypothetical protein
MKVRGEKLKRKRRPSKSFGELIQKLWQPEPDGLNSQSERRSRKS